MKAPKPILWWVSDVTSSWLNKSTDSGRKWVDKLNIKTWESIDHILNENMPWTEIFWFLGILKRTLQNMESPWNAQLLRLIDEMLIHNEEGQLPEDKKMMLVALMYQASLTSELLELKEIDGFKELVSKIIFIDSFSRFNWISTGEKFVTGPYWYFLKLQKTLHDTELLWKESLQELISVILKNDFDNGILKISEEEKQMIVAYMYELRLWNELMELKKIPWFEELVSRIIIIDSQQKDKLFDF
ncbi:MAG: hypothetical protein ACD_3C00109G0012 [uncultured bacterium (gcode 4)]|uniref:Uncharacterized protein n=1 Tax=uncultured bacterium (gcode 4) TaxID=1234023 RepID=K2FYL6_9BACT|nr:MAG: hypothetical protein ACD_3C00109G0012 [uncultured bacterium (gcode 4)]